MGRDHLNRIKQNPLHFITGIGVLLNGVQLWLNDAYFTWPPVFRDFANDDVVGFSLVLVGLSMIIWVLDGREVVEWNRWALVIASILMSLLTIYQFLHFIAVGEVMPWIQDGIITGYITFLARGSNTGA